MKRMAHSFAGKLEGMFFRRVGTGKSIEQESGLGFEVLSLFLINYITLDNPFGILESPFSHYKIGIIASPLTTLQGYCVYNSG